MYKRCYKCKSSKAISDFYKDNSKSDKLDNKCKDCRHAYYVKNAKHYRLWRKENKDKLKEGFKRWYSKAKNMKQLSSNFRTHYLIKSGKLTRLPCKVCSYFPSEAHHEDYAKPQKVTWLCKSHHNDLHRGVL